MRVDQSGLYSFFCIPPLPPSTHTCPRFPLCAATGRSRSCPATQSGSMRTGNSPPRPLASTGGRRPIRATVTARKMIAPASQRGQTSLAPLLPVLAIEISVGVSFDKSLSVCTLPLGTSLITSKWQCLGPMALPKSNQQPDTELLLLLSS